MKFEEIFSPDKILITTAVLATLGLFLVSVLIGVTTRRRQRQVMTNCRYRPRKRLMEGPEKKCFQMLIDLFGQKFYIIPQVELSALLNHKVGTQDRHTAYHFIEHKTVDFVLCNKRTLRPICAVKLDEGKSPKSPGDTVEDIQKFFHSAHLPFVSLPKKQTLTRQAIIDEFSRVIYETSTIKPTARGRKKKPASA